MSNFGDISSALLYIPATRAIDVHTEPVSPFHSKRLDRLRASYQSSRVIQILVADIMQMMYEFSTHT